MIKPLLFSVVMLASANSFAAPNQLDVIGLVPDVSTPDEVNQVQTGEYGTFVIGGLNLLCTPEYIEEKLSSLFCLLKKSPWQPLSNQSAFAILNTGFTKKFGVPTGVESNPVSNRMGAKFQQKIVRWKDKKGNELMIANMLGEVDSGMLHLESASRLAKAKAEAKEKAKSVKF